ncbi:caspase family protein [Microcoleus sp. K1-B6]|uniref:nSTAND1 domain-containing NTPase n=1 Tax=unclassified Microcoleus TaxID=2642155 RepID=UPI002FD5BC87
MSEFLQRLAVVIGINQYENGIATLRNAVNDAEKIDWLLKEQHGYQTWLLLDGDATQAKLNELLTETLPKYVKSDGCLLFYFAGHGIALEGDDGPQGYLIPQDAINGNSSSYLPMSQVHDALTTLSCRHFLAILDCCFAGAFRWSSTRDFDTVPEEIYLEHYYRFIKEPAWQVITSASYDQTSLDKLSLRDCRGEKGNNSPFTAALIDALKGEADTSPPAKDGKPQGDGVITATELYSYLRDCIEPPTNKIGKRQTPGLWHLRNHDRGEYIFLTPGHDLNLRNAPPLDKSKNPYRGLEPFDEDQQHWFFGRTALVNKLYEFVNNKALTVVLGASGAGKSSLVRAGLIPELRKNQPAWTILDPIRPGESPFRNLNNALKKANFSEVEVPNTALAQSIKNLNNSIKVWASSNPGSKVLLFIDQSEELITLCKNDIERQEFLSQLAHAISTHSHQLRVVITVRSDFEPQLRDFIVKLLPNTLHLDNTAINDSWQTGRFTVPVMTRSQLREAIEKPAEARVMYFDSHQLVEDLITEVADMPGALPLLSFALSELYLEYLKRQKEAKDKGITIDRAITQEDYKKIGGVTQSLTQRADQEYQKLVDENPAYEQIVRNVMLRMVALGGGELARRRVPMSELNYPEAIQAQVEEAIQCFSKVRLLIPGKDGEDNPYVEPAHDALVRGWSKIRNWLGERQEKTEKISQFNKIKSLLNERIANIRSSRRLKRNNSIAKQQESEKPLKVNLPLQRQLTTAANNWLSKQEKEGNQKASGFLWYDDPRLPQLEQIQQSSDNWFNQMEAAFIQRSLQRRRNNRLRTTGIVTTFLIGVQVFAFTRAQEAYSRSLATSSEAFFALNQRLEALVEGIKAGKNIKWVIGPDADTTNQIMTALHQVIYDVTERNRWQGRGKVVNSINFSPNGKMLASGSDDGTIQLWNLEGKELRTLPGHSREVQSVSFSPDGTMLASSSSDGTVKLWNLDGKELRTLKTQSNNWAFSVSFSPDGKMLASANSDGTVKLWNLAGKELRVLKYTAAINSVAFSPDGKVLASANSDGTVKLWNLDGKELRMLKANTHNDWRSPVNSVSFSPDGTILASAGNDGAIKLWSLDGKEIKTLKGRSKTIWRISFSPDGKMLASANFDDTITLWSLDGKELKTLKGQNREEFRSVSFSPDGKMLASGSNYPSVTIWSLEGNQPRMIEGDSTSICFSPDGKILASASNNGTIKLLTIGDGQEIRLFKYDNHPVWSISFSRDGKMLVAGYVEGTIKLWRIEDGKELKSFKGDSYTLNSISFSPDSKILASPALHNSIKLWSLEGKVLRTLKGHSREVLGVSFSPNGKILASASRDGTIKLWGIKDGKKLETLAGHNDAVVMVRFSPDGKMLASASYDDTLKLWRIEDGKELKTFRGHRTDVSSLSFSPDGKMVTSGDVRGTIKLWNLDGKELSTLQGYSNQVASLNFSPDGKMLTAAGGNKILLWNLDLDDLLELGCNWVRDYYLKNPNLNESDRHLCDNIPPISPSQQTTGVSTDTPSSSVLPHTQTVP